MRVSPAYVACLRRAERLGVSMNRRSRCPMPDLGWRFWPSSRSQLITPLGFDHSSVRALVCRGLTSSKNLLCHGVQVGDARLGKQAAAEDQCG